jgi:hypothetical protein
MIFCSTAFSQVRYDLTVVPEYGRMYPPGRWVPLRIEARNNTQLPVDGAVIIPVVQPAVATDFRIPVFSPPNSSVILTAYAYLPAKVLGKLNEGTGSVPVANAEWHDAEGATLVRAKVLGRPDTADHPASAGASGTGGFLILSVGGGDSSERGSTHFAQGLVRFLAANTSYAINVGTSEARWLPRHRAGYGAVRAIVFDGTPPDSLDVSQRETILEYLRGGGTLVLPAPRGSADPTGTWLEPYLPVHIIGSREMDQILPSATTSIADSTTAASAPLKFIKPLGVVEAVDGDGEVLLRDRYYVHVAIRHLGLGRIVFTSFPIDAFDQSNTRAAELWRTILDLRARAHDWSETRLGQHRDDILESTIGAPVSPWSYAAIIVGGYVVLTLLLQLIGRGARRPTAFVVGTALAVAMFATLTVMAMVRRGGSKPLSAALLETIELGPQGGGIRQEAEVFLGRSDPSFALKADLRASLRPVVADPNDPAIIEQLPFAAPQAGVRTGRIDRVWQADEALPESCALLSGARFTPAGVRIDVENRTGQTLLAPLVLWNRNCYRVGDLPPGRSSSILGDKNPPGDFTNVSVITGEEANLRGRILELALTAKPETDDRFDIEQPRVAGWLDPSSPGPAKPILHTSSPIQLMNAEVLLSAPVSLLPSFPQTVFHISSDFVTTTFRKPGRSQLYDAATRQWLGSIITGTWNVGFQIPRGIGKVKPISATISADLAASHHIIVLRRGQASGGTWRDNPAGPIVAEWKQAAGSKTATIDLDDNDVDSNGCLWLRLTVKEADATDMIEAPWKFNSLSVGFEAQAHN